MVLPQLPMFISYKIASTSSYLKQDIILCGYNLIN